MPHKKDFNPRMTPAEIKEKVRENRLRRALSRRGYALMKSRRRDPNAVDYGCYIIVDSSTNFLVAGVIPNTSIWNFSLDDVEDWMKLTGRKRVTGKGKQYAR